MLRIAIPNKGSLAASASEILREAGYRQRHDDKQLTLSLLATCIEACVECAGSCEAHGQDHEHCRLCAQACRACEQACQALIDAIKQV